VTLGGSKEQILKHEENVKLISQSIIDFAIPGLVKKKIMKTKTNIECKIKQT